jgi:hypothetical protein
VDIVPSISRHLLGRTMPIQTSVRWPADHRPAHDIVPIGKMAVRPSQGIFSRSTARPYARGNTNPVARSFEVAEALGGIQPVSERDCRCPRFLLPAMNAGETGSAFAADAWASQRISLGQVAPRQRYQITVVYRGQLCRTARMTLEVTRAI